MAIITNPLNRFCIVLILIYKKTKIRKHDKCLHYPSCSNYGILALKKYNLYTAIKKTAMRISDCNPFSGRAYIDYPWSVIVAKISVYEIECSQTHSTLKQFFKLKKNSLLLFLFLNFYCFYSNWLRPVAIFFC